MNGCCFHCMSCRWMMNGWVKNRTDCYLTFLSFSVHKKNLKSCFVSHCCWNCLFLRGDSCCSKMKFLMIGRPNCCCLLMFPGDNCCYRCPKVSFLLSLKPKRKSPCGKKCLSLYR